MIKRVAPGKPLLSVIPKSGIQQEASPDAEDPRGHVGRKKREKDENAPRVRVRLSKTSTDKGQDRPDTVDDSGAGTSGRKKIDIMA